MNSIMTNTSAMTALQTLNQTNHNLNQTQNRISTGYKVASAADDAAYWSIATTMRSDNSALSTVNEALGLGAATVDVASTGLTSAIEVVDEIKTKLVAAREPGVDRSKVQAEIDELQSQLQSIGSSATFSGENWLSINSDATGYNATENIVASFNRSDSGVVSVSTISISKTSSALYDAGSDFTDVGIIDAKRNATTGAKLGATAAGEFDIATLDISSLTDSTADLATLDGYIKGADAAVQELTNAASDLGAVSSRIDLQRNFVTSLIDSIDRGIGALVDADLNEESTRLNALQTQQQLGIQALSIANSNSQNLLSLFR